MVAPRRGFILYTWFIFFGGVIGPNAIFGEPPVGQGPVVISAGFVNAASCQADPDRGPVIVPGRLFSLFGEHLAGSDMVAGSSPLPTTLGGVSVTVDGRAAPLLFVSPSQINLQAPFEIDSSMPEIVVMTPNGASDPVRVRLAYDAPGIFAQGACGCGHGAILNVAEDGSVTINTPDRSAAPGDFVSVFASGFGPVSFPPLSGSPSASTTLSVLQSVPVGQLGSESSPILVPVQFAGLAPGMVGVDQINLRLPDDAPEGCAIPLWLLGASSGTQPVTLSIHKGRGKCQDPSMVRTANLTWMRTYTTGPGPSAATVEETFSAAFREGAASWLGPTPDPTIGKWRSFGTAGSRPRCGGYAGSNTDAGTLIIQTGILSQTLVPLKSATGEFLYSQVLPPGSIRPGRMSVVGQGSSAVGPFDSRLDLPAPIEITTNLNPGTTIESRRSFRLSWINGRPGDLVNVRLLSGIPLGQSDTIYSGLEYYAPAEEGSVTLDPIELLPGRPALPLAPSDNFAVIVRYFPRRPGKFAAAGLTLDGEHQWVCEFRFLGLRLQSTND
jgi:uncharacterized protein (TIGR03437 family)